MRSKLLGSVRTIALLQALAFVAGGVPAMASSVGTPPGGNRSALDFRAGTPFSVSTWTPAHNAHIPGISNGLGLAKHGYVLDLTSTNTIFDLSRSLMGRNTITLNLGGTQTPFTSGSPVTAAEFIAVLQVLQKQSFDLSLNGNGTAAGAVGNTVSNFTLNRLISPRIQELVIPAGVTAFDNVARNPLLGISGNLLNYGTIYFYTTSSRIHTGLFYAANTLGNGGDIINESTGLLSTQLPAGVLPTSETPRATANLTLAADNNIINNGAIISSGNLKLATAYGSITNAPAVGGGVVPLIQAYGNIAFIPGADTAKGHAALSGPLMATVTNLGNVISSGGNITINSPVNQADIVLVGTGTLPITGGGTQTYTGLMQAYSGYIGVREATYRGYGDTLINGGDYEAQQGFNINGGYGNVVANTNSPLTTDAPTSAFQSSLFSVNTKGMVDIIDSTNTGITVNNSTGSNFILQTFGNTNLNSIAATNGALTIDVQGGELHALPGVTLSATGVNPPAGTSATVTLEADDVTVNSTTVPGTIVLDTASNVFTAGTGGPVNITINPLTTPVAGTEPSGVNVTGTTGTNAVFWGTYGITANGTNTLTLKSQNIVFQESTNASQITLNGFVNITADPVTMAVVLTPASATTPVTPVSSPMPVSSNSAGSMLPAAMVAPSSVIPPMVPAVLNNTVLPTDALGHVNSDMIPISYASNDGADGVKPVSSSAISSDELVVDTEVDAGQ